ncbi:hypothetical protein KUCAC02_025002 [Chaenocephalus aceratus]|nr:hypothetical protein KUCAC02_025002 [Chaenocephalus aceratus]
MPDSSHSPVLYGCLEPQHVEEHHVQITGASTCGGTSCSDHWSLNMWRNIMFRSLEPQHVEEHHVQITGASTCGGTSCSDHWSLNMWRNIMFRSLEPQHVEEHHVQGESRFCRQHMDRRVTVWRKRRERFADCCTDRVGEDGLPAVLTSIPWNPILGSAWPSCPCQSDQHNHVG